MNSKDARQLLDMLPWPSSQANKYTRGKLVLVAGSERYPGAACLAAKAAQRMGAGYVEVFTPSPLAKQLVLGACPSAVIRMIDELRTDALTSTQRRPQALCIGPGFDPGDEQSGELLAAVLKKAACPVVIDGGALSFLAGKGARKALRKRSKGDGATVITPHGGEASRIAEGLGIASEDPGQLAMELSSALGAVVALKGPTTFIASGNVLQSMHEGTAALAKAGTGDVLAGMIGALLAQGVAASDAALLGTTLHARAGVAASETHTIIGTVPEDVIECIPQAIKSLAESL